MSKIIGFNKGDFITRYKRADNCSTSFIGEKCLFNGISNGAIHITTIKNNINYVLNLEDYSKGWMYYIDNANKSTQQKYTEEDLVSFGNYLLSTERDRVTEFFKEEVTHADLENWKKVNKY